MKLKLRVLAPLHPPRSRAFFPKSQVTNISLELIQAESALIHDLQIIAAHNLLPALDQIIH